MSTRVPFIAVISLTIVAATWAATPWQDKIDPWVLETARSGETEYIVFLTDQADLSATAQMRSRLARGALVHQALTAVAERSQRAILAELETMGVEHRSYWIANMIWVRGGMEVIQAMAERPDVAHVYANPRVHLNEPVATGEGLQSRSRGVEWNIALVNADDVWAAGFDGDGVVVGGQDTGYRWDHPALVQQYRGGPGGSHDYSWHDAIHSGGGSCGADSPFPCDDHGHGTHTMGTVVGDDGAGNQVGMAPGARWIGCRNMDQGDGTPITYADCYQWFVAPTDVAGQNPDPAMAPDVINNSWGCPPSEGCTDPNVLLTVVQNVRAAGIVTVHSAGNGGPGCSSVATPSAIYEESFSVGATDSGDDIASFSSRGPVTVDGSQRRKPDVTAPGVDIRSSTRDGGYQGGWDGTSMAGPHVAGAVALLLSAQPGLAGDVDTIEEVIEQTAVPLTTTQGCGGDGPEDVPNNVYGWGRIDALAAVMYSLDFVLEVTPEEVAVCAPADVEVGVEVLQFQGFSEPVTLSTDGLPTGASASFSVNPVTPPGSSTLTVGDTGSVAVGTYPVALIGTSSPSGIEHDATFTLEVYDATPGAPAPITPADGATDVPVSPELSWNGAAQAASYTVEIASDEAFTNVVYTATSEASVHLVETVLEPATRHYWRVAAANPCGAGGHSDVFTFTTRAVPPVLLVDDDDNSPDVRSTYIATLDALGIQHDVWDTGEGLAEPGSANLALYATVIWFTGDHFGGDAGPSPAAEGDLAAWLDGDGQCLLISSQDYHWDRQLTAFMQSHLGVAAVDDDEGQSTVSGSGAFFAGLGPYALSYPFSDYSDVLSPDASAEAAFIGDSGTAAVSKIAASYTTSFWGFPFEALPSAGDREAAMGAFLAGCTPAEHGFFEDGFESGDTSAWALAAP